jgi:cobalamin 5'-phosphate synthase/cobalamin synthase
MRAAIGFLTVVPVGGALRSAPGRNALLAFPLVGFAVGGATAAVAWGGAELWTVPVGAALAVALDLLLTGALHVDAVADTADGLASRRPADEALRIMREPTVGAVGAAAAAVTLLLRFAWIAALASEGLWWLIPAAPACGRAAMVVALAAGGSPASGSLASGLGGAASRAASGVVILTAIALSALAGAAGADATGAALGVAAALAATVVAFAGARAWRRRFGGMTGDGAGALGTLAELSAFAVLALTPLWVGS